MIRFAWSAVLAAVAFPLGLQAAQVRADAYVNTPFGTGPVTSTPSDPLAVSDSIATFNGYGAAATAAFSGSLASASLTTDVSAVADPADIRQNSASAFVDEVYFNDVLSFQIPAGVYDAPVMLRLHGFTLGSLRAEGCAQASRSFCSNGYAVVHMYAGGGAGSDVYDRRVEVNAFDVAAASFNDFFMITLPILQPKTLAAPTIANVTVTSWLTTRGAAVNTHGYPDGAARTDFAGDAWAAYTSLEVDHGLAWTSASGVFLSQPVPEPAPALLLMGGLAVLAAGRRRRRLS